MNPLLLAELFWQDHQAPVEILLVLLASGVFVKWVVADFRHSRVSAITLLLVVLSLLGPIWAAMYVVSPGVQSSLDQSRHHRELIQPVLRCCSPQAQTKSDTRQNSNPL